MKRDLAHLALGAAFTATVALLSYWWWIARHHETPPDWDACVQTFGPTMRSATAIPDHQHGVTIQLVGKSGKTLAFSVYPNEAQHLAHSLNEAAGTSL